MLQAPGAVVVFTAFVAARRAVAAAIWAGALITGRLKARRNARERQSLSGRRNLHCWSAPRASGGIGFKPAPSQANSDPDRASLGPQRDGRSRRRPLPSHRHGGPLTSPLAPNWRCDQLVRWPGSPARPNACSCCLKAADQPAGGGPCRPCSGAARRLVEAGPDQPD